MSEHTWEVWRFSQAPDGFWDDKDNRQTYFDWLAQQLSVETVDNWKNVKKEDVIAKGGLTALHYYGGSLSAAIKDLYPSNL